MFYNVEVPKQADTRLDRMPTFSRVFYFRVKVQERMGDARSLHGQNGHNGQDYLKDAFSLKKPYYTADCTGRMPVFLKLLWYTFGTIVILR